MILGGSRYQLEVIDAARKLGLRVVTVDNVPTNPGHALADRTYFVDTTAEAEVLMVAEREHVSAVIAACTDVAVPTAAFIAERSGLPGVPADAARVLTGKLEFRYFQRKSALATMEFTEATNRGQGLRVSHDATNIEFLKTTALGMDVQLVSLLHEAASGVKLYLYSVCRH
jgi:formate-dependent phosphoribosylglycinamide formyltransferase (GAR transformylase)